MELVFTRTTRTFSSSRVAKVFPTSYQPKKATVGSLGTINKVFEEMVSPIERASGVSVGVGVAVAAAAELANSNSILIRRSSLDLRMRVT